jgi:hypothetical protein
MADERGLPDRLPAGLFPASMATVYGDSMTYVSVAALAVAALILLSHVFGLAGTSHLSFRRWLLVAFDPPTGLRIAGAVMLAAVAPVLGRQRLAGAPRHPLSDLSLAIAAGLAVVVVGGSIVGALDYVTYLGTSVRSTLDAVCFELAVMVLALAAALCALGELHARRHLS